MLDLIRKNISTIYRELCKRLKINNWQKEVFMSNAIEIMDKMEKRITSLEKEVDKLKKQK